MTLPIPAPKRGNFLDYFFDDFEYPRDIAFNPLPLGSLYSYVVLPWLNKRLGYEN